MRQAIKHSFLKAFLFIVISVVVLTLPSAPACGFSTGVNAGGSRYESADGKIFKADREYSEGSGYGYVGGSEAESKNRIKGTDDAPLFQTERWGLKEYKFDLPDGVYKVSIYLAEFFFEEPSKRVFDIAIEDRLVKDNLDIYSAYGQNEAVVLEYAVKVDDGQLNIKTKASVDNPKLSAIYIETIEPDKIAPEAPSDIKVYERDGAVGLIWLIPEAMDLAGYKIYRASSADKEPRLITDKPISGNAYVDKAAENGQTYFYAVSAVDVFGNESGLSDKVEATPTKRTREELRLAINCGGKKVSVDGAGFIEDIPYNIARGYGYVGGLAVDVKQEETPSTPAASTLREGFSQYIYDVPNGVYKITLGFVEPEFSRDYKRCFSVFAEGRRYLKDYDIYRQAGFLNLVTVEFFVLVRDGQVNISPDARNSRAVLSYLIIEPAEADKKVPDKIEGVELDAREDRLYVLWDEVEDNDVIGFNVYRSEDKGRNFAKINTSPVGIEQYKDTEVELGKKYYYYVSALDVSLNESKPSRMNSLRVRELSDDEFLEMVQKASFKYFWDEADQVTGLVKDQSTIDVVSVASTGFGLAAMTVAAEHEFMDKDLIEERTYNILKTLNENPKKHGLFFHYLDADGKPSTRGYEKVISTIDSGLLLVGAITAGEYFGGRVKEEADKMFEEANWRPFLDNRNMIYMAWKPRNENQVEGPGSFHGAWDYYTDESIICTLLGIAAPREEHRIPAAAFYRWTRARGKYGPKTKGYEATDYFVYSWSGALFTYQFAHLFIDFRLLGRDNPGGFGSNCPPIDWHENTVQATRAARLYCIDYKDRFKTFGENSWGLTACDGETGYLVFGFMPRASAWDDPGDGTIAPYGAGCSLPYLPDEVMAALKHYYNLRDEDGNRLVWQDEYEGGYGFWDSFNLDTGFVADTVIGIDQGPLMLAIENYRTGLIWETFMENKYIREGLNRIEFENKLR